MSKLKRIGGALLLAAVCYAVIACTRYAFAHPELTDTQRVLHFLDALLWR